MGKVDDDDEQVQPLRPPVRPPGSSSCALGMMMQGDRDLQSRPTLRSHNRTPTDTDLVSPVARMPSSDDNDDDNDSDSDEEAAPKTTLNRTARVSTGATFPGAVAVDGIDRLQRQQSEGCNANDDDNDTLIIQSGDDNDHTIPPTLLLQESALQHSVVAAELAPDDDLSVRVAQRVEANLTERLKQEVEARLSLHLTQEQQRHPIVSAQAVNDNDNDIEEGGAAIQSSTGTDQYDNFKICGLRRTCWGILLSILGMVIVGAVVGVYFYVSNQQDEKKTIPLNAPTPSPSSSPTGVNLWDDLLQLIGDRIININDDIDETTVWLEDPTAPQYAALDWMAKDDEYTYTRITVLLEDLSSSSSSPDQQEEVVVVLVERYALAVLYFATNGPSSWKLSLDFLKPTSVCDWNIGGTVGGGDEDQTTTTMGVYCNTIITDTNTNTDSGNDETLSVTTLHMAENGLQGRVPWELSLLSGLIQINFDSNSLLGGLPIEFSNLTNLQDMWLRSNFLSGRLPTSYSLLTQLQSVDLQDNRLTGPLPADWGTSLTNLFYLSLKGNQLEGTLPVPWAQGLVRLRLLDLEGNRLTGSIPTQLGGGALTELVSLFLESNHLDGPLPSELGRLTGLKHFLVNDNQLTGSVPNQWRRNTSLEVFWFHGNDLTGSVDDVFCRADDPFASLVAELKGDCSGDPPEIICSCCSTCCAFYGRDCRPQSN